MTFSSRRLFFVPALLCGALGCKQIIGLHDKSVALADAGPAGTGIEAGIASTSAADSCGHLRHPSPACAACISQSCCAESQACAQDSACGPTFECQSSCADGSCRSRCETFYSRTDASIALDVCRESNCAKDCGSQCGDLSYDAPGCDDCVRATCCDEAAACANNPSCLMLRVCRLNCLPGSETCPPECDKQYPEGSSDFRSWNTCTQNQCGQSCQRGNSWACLDEKPVWPRPRDLDKITFSVTIVDLLLETPFAHVVVKACDKVLPACDRPYDQQTADDTGLVKLTVPAGSEGFDGFLDITGGDNGSGIAIFPSMWYPIPPVISGGWRGRVQFPSEDEIPALAALVGTTIDPARGHFAANAYDCNFAAAPGVSLAADSADEQTHSFYFLSGLPTITATQTDGASAIAGFVNLPARQVRVSATWEGKSLGDQLFTIRAGTFTTSSFPPQPR